MIQIVLIVIMGLALFFMLGFMFYYSRSTDDVLVK